MPVENVTPNRDYPLPYADNDLVDDVARIIFALYGIDLDMANTLAALLTKADANHGHAIGDITGLVAVLAAKEDRAGKGQANGYAALDGDGRLPAAQLPDELDGGVF